jgi:hypothetical protein
MMAKALGNSGDAAGGLRLDESLELTHLIQQLEADRRNYGSQSEEVFSAMHNLAASHVRLGDDASALPLLTEALTGLRRLKGEEHENTLASTRTLAKVHVILGDHKKGISMAREVLRIQHDSLGPNHLEVMTGRLDLGRMLTSAGECNEAQALLKEVTTGLKRVLGDDHPHTADAMLAWKDALDQYGASTQQNVFDNELFDAAREGHGSEVSRLLAAGANPNALSAYFLLEPFSFEPREAAAQCSPLCVAAANGHLEVAELLLEGGACHGR